MIIDTSDFCAMPRLTAATLSESADSASVLTLAWQGYGPEWLEYMLPVTVMHRGRVLFHGRVTSYSRANEAGEVQTSAMVTDALWLLDNLPLGAQVAELQAANEATAVDLQAAGQQALESWAALAESCQVVAPLWVVTEDGEAREDGRLWLDVSAANFSTGAFFKREKAITAWTALLTMKNANPDAFFRYHPTTGAVEVVSLKNAPVIEWDIGGMQLLSCTDIGPQYEECITGVALVVSWKRENEDGSSSGGSKVYTYPEGIAEGDMGVKIFSASAEDPAMMKAQGEYMMRQIRSYYDACNELQWSGSVTALLANVSASPLCCRMNITGKGAHESWGNMRAMVSGVEWDFVGGTVEAELGIQFDEPEISEMVMTIPDAEDEEPDEPESSSSTTTTTHHRPGGHGTRSTTTTTESSWYLPSTTKEESTTEETEDTTTTWDYTTRGEETAESCEHSTTWPDCEHTWGCEHSTTWPDCEHTTTEECCPICTRLAERVAALEAWREEVMAWAKHVEERHCDHDGNEFTEWAGVTGPAARASLLGMAANELNIDL